MRLVQLVVIYLCVGLVTSVAVAWLIAFCWSTGADSGDRSSCYCLQEDPDPESAARLWTSNLTVRTGFGMQWIEHASGGWLPYLVGERVECQILDSRVPAWARGLVAPVRSPESRNVNAQAQGWPLLALWCAPRPENGVTTNEPFGGIELPWSLWRPVPGDALPTLPLIPIWWGLLIDSVLWGLAMATVIRVSRTLFRRSRRSRGRCERCGHSLGPVRPAHCPECGSIDGAH